MKTGRGFRALALSLIREIRTHMVQILQILQTRERKFSTKKNAHKSSPSGILEIKYNSSAVAETTRSVEREATSTATKPYSISMERTLGC